ncbi:MAG: hypothetical protein KAS71_09475, partial [Bacteroidales bacterium]|nr:hypothetical protein [Bacteroidales bacterium]
MKRFLISILLSTLLLTPQLMASGTIFVSPSGDDANPGTIGSPLKTVQKAVDLCLAGDTIYLREGLYHEEVLISNKNATAEMPIVITAYNSENVIMDGSVDLEEIKSPGAVWELATDTFPGTSTIYKLQLEEDIWQLFVEQPGLMLWPNAVGGELADYRMQVVARWPNGGTHPNDPLERLPLSYEVKDKTWWSLFTTWANPNGPGTTFTSVESLPDRGDLAGTNLSFEGGTAILSVYSQGPANVSVEILEHEKGSNTFHHSGTEELSYYREGSFIIEHLNALDVEDEWYFDKESKIVYVYLKGSQDPNEVSIRGKRKTNAFTLINSSHIEFIDIGLFATTLKLDADHVSFTDGVISYPDMPKRILGIHDDGGPAIDAKECTNFTMRNSNVEYTQYHIIEVNDYNVFDNNYFHHLAIMGLGKTGCFLGVNTFKFNTLHTIGTRAAVKTNSQPESGRYQSWNILDGWGFLYANDGVGFQSNQGNSVNSERAYNWFLRSNRTGIRYDGPDEGLGFPTLGLSHHLVGLRCVSTSTAIKGDYNQVYNYTDIESTNKDKGGLYIRWNQDTGEGNAHTITKNNAVEGINMNEYWPIPGDHTHNWDASRDGGSILEFVPNADLLDFRPKANSPLVNAGTIIDGINDNHLGPAPDIGAYEWGDDIYWIPGYRKEKTSIPIPFDGATDMPLDRHLIFLNGYETSNSILFFGTDKSAVENADTESAITPGTGDPFAGDVVYLNLTEKRNIVTPTMILGNPNNYDPSPYLLVDDPLLSLNPEKTYYWRADAVQEDGSIIKGDVWEFTTGGQTYNVRFKLHKKKDGIVTPSTQAVAVMERDSLKADSTGNTFSIRRAPGTQQYTIKQKGYLHILDSVLLSSDTIVYDTLDFTTYSVNLKFIDRDTEEVISFADVNFGDLQLRADNLGDLQLSNIEYAEYPIKAAADDYIAVENLTVEIFSDTLLTIKMTRDYVHALVLISDKVSGAPIYRAMLTSDTKLEMTNTSGELTVKELLKGWWKFTITHDDYFPITDSVLLDSDTTVRIELNSKYVDVRFNVQDAEGSIEYAQIDFGVWTSNSDIYGFSAFYNKLAREDYLYSVEKEGYHSVIDSFYLETDTLVNIFLNPIIDNIKQTSEGIKVYPNPVINN